MKSLADERTKKLLIVMGILLGMFALSKCGNTEDQVVQNPDSQVQEQIEPAPAPEPEPEPEQLSYSDMDESIHQQYIAAVNRNLVTYNISASALDDSTKLQSGWRVCESLDSGQTLEQFFKERFDASQMTDSETAAAVVVGGSVADAAVKTYCPQHTHLLGE